MALQLVTRAMACSLLLWAAGCAVGSSGRPMGEDPGGDNVVSTATASDSDAAQAPGSSADAINTGIRGTVTNADGAPLAQATIGRSAVNPTTPMTLQAVLTDADGHYWWPLPPGRWLLTASAPGVSPSTREITIESAKVSVLDFQLR